MKHWSTVRPATVVKNCRDQPKLWSNYQRAARSEFNRTGNPIMQARVAAVALRLGRRVPAWAAPWAAAAMELLIDKASSLDRPLGISRGSGRDSYRSAEAREAATTYETWVMKALTEIGTGDGPLSVRKAAEHTETMLKRHFPAVKRGADTIEHDWHHGRRKDAERLPPLIAG